MNDTQIDEYVKTVKNAIENAVYNHIAEEGHNVTEPQLDDVIRKAI